ncbi:cytochrome b/b6 domain-containing protein [Altererythrobacter sp. GH1-8]|uniref:cytochrome b/b6 domain-containing protein n=1 Tax=Altererythrobacter sp. GH1-8 TaxID=3349333 RepID=UPI00374DD99B
MGSHTIRVWDLPVRLCHWGTALAIPALWWTAENGEMGWHMRIGLFLLFILTFRVLWGLIGTRTARFAQFVRGPRTVWRYLTGSAPHDRVGHNPLGALSVIVLLGILIAQVTLGLFAGDSFDGATGPLNEHVGVMTADWMTDWHKTLFDVIVVVSGLHIAAIAFYWLARRNNLVTPMITGNRAASGLRGAGNDSVSFWRLTASCVIAASLVIWLEAGAPTI